MSSDHLEQPGENAGEQGGPHPPEPPNHRQEPPSAWLWRLIVPMILGAILVVLVIIGLALYGASKDDHAKASDQTLGDFASQVKAACTSNPTEARKVFGDACGKAQAIDNRPTGQKAAPPIPGPSGPPGPGVSAAQLQSVVTAAIRAYRPALTTAQVEQIARVTAPKVARPKDGKTPTAAELRPLVAVAVTSFCGEGRCVGKQGKQGDPGQDAPPVTDERLSALIDTSLRAYCAQHNGCIGADSTVPGPTGPPGPQGRGITSGPTCMGSGADSYWLTKYSDDTEQRQDGPCRTEPAVPVIPTS